MANTRTVTGTILKPDGTVYTDWAVKFALLTAIISDGDVIPAQGIEVTTANDGTFSVTLTVPDSGTASYQLILRNGYSQDFNLADGSSIDLSEILSIPTVAVDPNYITELIIGVDDTATVALTKTGTIITADLVDSYQLKSDFDVREYGAVGDGVTDDTVAIQAAITAAYTAGGGQVFIPAGTYLLSASLILRKGVSIRGVYPGITPDSTDVWDNGWTVSTGTVITYPTGIVFAQDPTAEVGTGDAIDGVIIESLGFDNVLSIITAGKSSTFGLCGSVVRDIIGSHITGIAFDLTNIMHITMSNIKCAPVHQLLRITGDFNTDLADCNPGNSYFTNMYGWISASGQAEASIHIRTLDTLSNGTPMGGLNLTHIQINRFDSIATTGYHILIDGDSATTVIYGTVLNDLDLEGPSTSRVYLNLASQTVINQIVGQMDGIHVVAMSDIVCRSSGFNHIINTAAPLTLDFDDASQPTFFSGALESVVDWKYPMGIWYTGGATNEGVINFDNYGHSPIIGGTVYTMPIVYPSFASGGGIREKVTNWAADLDLPVYMMGIITLSKAGDQAVTLPDAATCKGQKCMLKKTGASGTATLTPAGAQTIDGAASNIWLDTQYKYIEIQSDGAVWLIVSKG